MKLHEGRKSPKRAGPKRSPTLGLWAALEGRAPVNGTSCLFKDSWALQQCCSDGCLRQLNAMRVIPLMKNESRKGSSVERSFTVRRE